MSARLLLTTTTRAIARPAFSLPAYRTFSLTATRTLKESTSDPNPDEYEHHKKDSLDKQKAGKGHWKPELASVSEESVKADRSGGAKTDKESLKKLQEETKGRAEETSKNRTSMRDGL